MNHEDYQSLGLTSLQADVIYALMQLGGEASAPEIIEVLSATQKVNRTSIYSVLSKLQQMGVVISNEERSSNYALISTSTDTLLDFLTKQHKQEIQEFTQNLRNAKAMQKRSQEFELYYVKTRDQILAQVDLILQQPNTYILLMANAPVLETLYDSIERIAKEKETIIMVLPTWNPNPEVDFNSIIKNYQQLLSKPYVAQPLPIFNRILPMMRQYLEEYSSETMRLSGHNSFVQLLTQDQWIMATYLDGDTPKGSGIYSREPMISQMMHILYMSIFENLADLSQGIIDQVMKIKTKATMKAYASEVIDKDST